MKNIKNEIQEIILDDINNYKRELIIRSIYSISEKIEKQNFYRKYNNKFKEKNCFIYVIISIILLIIFFEKIL